MSTKIRRELYSTAKKYLDIKSLFPKTSGVGRGGNITDYQARKIKSELNKLIESAGGFGYLERSFVPIKRTKSARAYLVEAGLPKSAKGVLLAGGQKVNSGATIRGGALFYRRGERDQVIFPLDARTEGTLRDSILIYEDYINNPENKPYIATHGGEIRGASVDAELEGDDAAELLINVATEIYNKYAKLAADGSNRPDDKRHGARKAVHPSKWGLSLLVEAK